MIAEREASQDSRLDPYTVRNIIERLSTLARRTADGLGQIDVTTIQAVFQEFAGFPPDEGAQQFLLRLPGLAPSSREDGSRTFVDRALADAAKAGDVVRFIEFPYGGQVEIFSGAISSVGGLGRGVILAQILNKTITGTQIIRAVEIASETNDCQQICPDLLYCYMILNDNVEFDAINIRGVTEDNLDFMIENSNIRNITFSDSMFSNISIDTDYPVADLPVFKSCIIGSLSGIYGEDNLPSNFIDPDIAEYSDTISTNADIFSASLPEPTKVLVSVLRKLFLQAGAGRQETAFTRGAMDARTKKLVPEVLSRIQAQGFADRTRMRGNWIWHPNRSRSHEARSIIFSPSNSEHPLAISVRDLS